MAKREGSPVGWMILGFGVGCLLLVLLFVVLCAGLVGAGVYEIRNAGPLDEAMLQVGANADVVEVLGEPIEAGWMMQGEFQTTDDAGYARATVPISGPRGTGELALEASKRGDRWLFDELVVTLQDGRRIDLRAQDPRGSIQEAVESEPGDPW